MIAEINLRKEKTQRYKKKYVADMMNCHRRNKRCV